MSTLKVQIGANISQLEKALNTAQGRLKSFGSKVSGIGQTLSTRVTAPLVALGGISLKTAADFETLQQSMNVLNGSVEEGARNFQRLKEFSAGTPFQLSDLADAQNMLQGFGLAADDAFESLSMIGDIAAITGGSIQGIGIAFGQAAAEGRLMSRDIRQLINQGVPAIQLLADTMGVAQSEVFDLASEGQISFEVLQQAFRDATTEGGMFANGMAQQANTLNGIWSTLKDNVSIALAELGNSISETFNIREHAKGLIENIQSIVKWFQSLSEEGRATMIKIVAAIGLVPPALIGLGTAFATLGIIIAGLTSPIFLVTAAISGIVLAFEYVRRNTDAFIDHLMFGFTNLKNDVIQNVADMQEAILSWVQFLPGVTEAAVIQARASILSLKDPVPKIKTEFQSLGDFFKSLGGDILEFTESMLGLDFSSMFEMDGGSGGGAAEQVKQWATDINSSIGSVAETNQETASRLAGSMAQMTAVTSGGMEAMRAQWQKSQDMAQQAAQVIMNSFINMGVSFFESLGMMLAGSAGMSEVFRSLLTNIADMAIQLGVIIMTSGEAIEALKASLVSFFGGSAVVAGAALIAIGAAAKGAISAIGRRGGSGGSSSIENFQRSATSVPSAQDSGGTVTFRIGNNELVGVLQQGSKRDQRVGKRVGLQ